MRCLSDSQDMMMKLINETTENRRVQTCLKAAHNRPFIS